MSIPVTSDRDHEGVARILGLPLPTTDNEPVRLTDLNSAVEGLAFKDNVRVATSSNINLASPGSALDGVTMAINDRVLVRGQSAAAENGLHQFNGAASAMTRTLDASTADELESAVVSVDEGTDQSTTWRQTAANFTLDTDPINWVAFGTSSPNTSTTTPGLIEIATQAEVDAGTDADRAITPITLSNYSGFIKKASGLIGDASATQFDVTHSFNTFIVGVEVYREAAPRQTIECEVQRLDLNTVRVIFAAAPTSNELRVVVMG